jgi:DNA-directed RNA polymerase subunit RPC12/RpoP
MSKHELDLLENALDSLAEALTKFEEGDAGNHKAYKFAVLHMSHFIELIFKHHIAEKHPLLIYKDPFSKSLDKNKTIGLWDAINFIANENADAISKELRADLEWLKRLRNDIEHHRFTMDVPEVRTTLGRLFRSVLEFLEEYTEIDVEKTIPANTLATFKVLSDEYAFRLQSALKRAKEIEDAAPIDYKDPDQEPARVMCDECGNLTMALEPESDTGYRCTMCGSEECDELPASCSICGARMTMGDLTSWETEAGDVEQRCYYCTGQYYADKDD